MHLLIKLTGSILLLAFAPSAWAQTVEKEVDKGSSSSQTASAGDSAQRAESAGEQTPEIWIILADGRRLQVDEVTERADGYWYKRANVSTVIDRIRVARVERSSPVKPGAADERLRGSGRWKLSDAARVESFFTSKFGRPLPLGAFGQSNLHTRWGLDHHNGMDVSLHPDSVEGRALSVFLQSEGIPFLAFRGAIPRVATGPHIHIGNPSSRTRIQHHAR